jgi:hypothetical protein
MVAAAGAQRATIYSLGFCIVRQTKYSFTAWTIINWLRQADRYHYYGTDINYLPCISLLKQQVEKRFAQKLYIIVRSAFPILIKTFQHISLKRNLYIHHSQDANNNDRTWFELHIKYVSYRNDMDQRNRPNNFQLRPHNNKFNVNS